MMKGLKILKFSVRMLCFILVSFLIGGSVFFVNARLVLHKQLPMIGGYGQAVVMSGSMSPTIEVDDLLIIKKCYTYKKGDIITFVDYANDLVTHRIVDINGKEVITKGDANNTTDKPFEQERIQGKVIKTIPKVGKLIGLLQNPAVVVMIVVIFILFMRESHNKAIEENDERLGELRVEIEKLKSEMENEDIIQDEENIIENKKYEK